MRPSVAILITACNRPAELEKTLALLEDQSYSPLQIVVIDDASTTPLETRLKQRFPSVTFWRNPRNLGYIASRSYGMSNLDADYIVSLDDDSAFISPDAIAKAVAIMEAQPRTGALTFRVHNSPDPPSTVEPMPQRIVKSFIGCGHMLRRSAIQKVGGYRDFFFYYYEENEYSIRLMDGGFAVLFVPEIVVHHRESQIGRRHSRVLGYSIRNSLWTVLLNFPFPAVVPEFLWKAGVGTFECLRTGKLGACVWAWSSFWLGMPRVLRLRKPISREALRRYNAVRFTDIGSVEQLETARNLTFGDLWRWFRSDWLRRRRARPFWDRKPGGVGVSRIATFGDPDRTA